MRQYNKYKRIDKVTLYVFAYFETNKLSNSAKSKNVIIRDR